MQKPAILTVGIVLLVGVHFAYAGETVDLGGLRSSPPKGWKQQTPSNKLRKYQFVIPKVAGDKEDAELAIFSFGAGDKEANIKRWKMQFIAPEGKTTAESSKVEEFKLGKAADVVCLDIWGTFKYRNPPSDPRAKEELKPNFRRFNVMLETDKGTYFITLTGPAKTMAKNKDAFDGWIKAFK